MKQRLRLFRRQTYEHVYLIMRTKYEEVLRLDTMLGVGHSVRAL